MPVARHSNIGFTQGKNGEGLSMDSIFSPFAGWIGERNEFRVSAAPTQAVSAKAGAVSAENDGGTAEAILALRSQAPEQEPKPATSEIIPARSENSPVETQFERVADRPPAATPTKTLGERLRRPLMLALPIVLAVFGAAYYLAEEPYVSTDDAFVRAAKITVNARVAGQAVEIAVRDNQRVRQGQVLFRIDPEPYQIAVDQAEARLASARLQIDGLKATYRQQQAELQSAKDSAAYDEREYERKKALVANDFTPREVYDQTETDSQGRPPARRIDRTADRQHRRCVERRSGYRGRSPSDGSRGQGPARPRPA